MYSGDHHKDRERRKETILERVMSQRMESELQDIDTLTEVNLAHVVMLAEREIIALEVAAALLGKLLDIADRGADVLGSLDSSEGLYLAYEASLIRDLGMEIGGAIHTARSRNDLGATTHRMSTRFGILQVSGALLALRSAALKKAEEHLGTVMTGYTHHQPAQPITYAHWLLALDSALSRDSDRLWAALACTNMLPLGSCALAGTDFPVDQDRTAQLLGFRGVMSNSLDAVAARDYALEVSSALAILATGLSRFALDLQVWCTHEFGLISLPDALSGVSSIMPQKRNPVALEWLKGRSAHISANLYAMLTGQKNTSYTNVIDVNRESLLRLSSTFSDLQAMLEMAGALIEGVVPATDRMLQGAAENFSTVTLLANFLVRREGLSFRSAYQVVSAVVRQALGLGLNSTEVDPELLAGVSEEVLGRRVELTEADIRDVLDPATNVRRLQYGGGPSPGRSACEIQRRVQVLEGDMEAVEGQWRRLHEAREALFATARQMS